MNPGPAEPGTRENEPGTRDKLIAAAAELIPEIGWGNVSTRRVADRAGVNPGVVHYHVGSISELLRAAAVRATGEFFEGPASRALASQDPEAALASLLGELSAIPAGDPQLVLLHESLVAAARDAGLRSALAAMLAGFRELIQQWLTEAGEPDAGRARAGAVTITAAIDGYLLQRALDPSLDPADLAAGLSRLIGPGGRDGTPGQAT